MNKKDIEKREGKNGDTLVVIKELASQQKMGCEICFPPFFGLAWHMWEGGKKDRSQNLTATLYKILHCKGRK